MMMPNGDSGDRFFYPTLTHDNYNCHNIYWDPLIWLVKNGHLIALTCISFSNEPSPYSWGGRGHSRQNYFCDTVQCFNEEKLLTTTTTTDTLPCTYSTPIFSGRKTKINLHTKPKWTVVIPIGCLLPCAVPEIFVMGGGGGGGGHVNLTKKTCCSFVCFCFFCFFLSPRLILQKSNG